MKQILLFILMILPVWISCSDGDNEVPISDESFITPDLVKEAIEKYGINPSGVEEINNIYSVIDSINYKLALGRKNNNAWIAKFNSSGNELFSTEIKDIPGHRKYGHCNMNSITFLQEGYLFLRGWFTNSEDMEQIINENNYTTFLSVVDFNTGKEIKRLITTAEGNTQFKVEIFSEDRFLVRTLCSMSDLSSIATITMLKNGSFENLWERDLTTYEYKIQENISKYNTILKSYGDYTYINGNKILYVIDQYGEELGFPNPIYSDISDYCKIIDLEVPTLIHGFNRETAPLFIDDDDNNRPICAFIKEITCKDNIIRISYKTCEYHSNHDPITDTWLPDTYTDIASYYYDISANDYSILDHVKVN